MRLELTRLCYFSKVYTTENAYRSHVNSKKHKENEVSAALRAKSGQAPSLSESSSSRPSSPVSETRTAMKNMHISDKPIVLQADEDATEEQINETIDQKIAAARSKLSLKQCLFCLQSSPTFDANLLHMASAHSFFIPDQEFLTDVQGLLVYLGEKISVGNVCIYCNGKGREFRTLDAVRKHMLDKSHCKIAYDTERDRLELSDYYDFSSSYPDYDAKKRKTSKRKKVVPLPNSSEETESDDEEEEEEEWEDTDDEDAEVDEVVDEEASESEEDSEEEDSPGDSQLTYGDSPYELVLPSGARIGHRSLRRYYAQSFSRLPSRNAKPEDPKSGAALVRKLLGDKDSQLVPVKGGYGAFGAGTQVVKARNRGEAREAGRHVREFRDQKRKEDYKTRVAYVHNYQKHYRDPLLQVSSVSPIYSACH